MSTPRPTEADVEALAKVLAQHQWSHTRDTHCSCGFRTPLAQLAIDGYLAHVATTLLASDWLAARDAEHEREWDREADALRQSRGAERDRADAADLRAKAAERALADRDAAIEALADEWKAHALDADCLDDDGSRCQRCTEARAIRALLPRDDAAGAEGAG